MNPDGWQPDPFNQHEERLFSKGEPTALVRDGGVGSYDEPPAMEIAPHEISQIVSPSSVPSPTESFAASPSTGPETPPIQQAVPVGAQPVPAQPARAQPVVAQPVVSWTTLAVTGALILAQSSHEFVVYEGQNTFGRWPNTQEGYHFAKQTYDAHAQSLAHGVAYTATGYRDPVALGLPTEPVVKSTTYASPMSFVGSTRRLIAWATKLGKRSPTFAALAWVVAILGMLFMWTFLLFWYFVVFFLFGVFTFPYRLIRRGQRKNLHIQKTTLATQQALLQQQQAMMQHQVQQPVAYAPSAQPQMGAASYGQLPPPGQAPPLPSG